MSSETLINVRKYDMINFKIVESIDFTEALCIDINNLYTSIGWGQNYSNDSIKLSLSNTDYLLFALDEKDKAIGLLRAFTDDVFVTWLSELAINKEYQKQGIATAMMEIFSKKFSHTSIYLEAFKGTEKFFSKFEITEKKKLVVCSRKKLK